MITLDSFSQVQSMYRYLRKQRENKRFAKSVEVAATFTLIIFFILFAIRPTFLTISKLLGEIKSKETLSSQMRTKINKIVAAETAFSEIQGNYDLIDASLPERPEYYQVYNNVSGAAQSASGQVGKTSFNLLSDDIQARKGDTNIYGINYITSNNFGSFISILNNLSQTRRIMELYDVRIAQADLKREDATAGASAPLNLTFSANLFVWKGKK